MDLRITHNTQYDYDAPVDYAIQKVRLRPQASVMQTVGAWDIHVTGGKIEASYQDHYGNHVDLISLTPGQQALQIQATGHVTTHKSDGVLGPVHGVAPLWHFVEQTTQTEPGEAIRSLPPVSADPAHQIESLHTISSVILLALPYQTGTTQSDTTAEEALAGKFGVCQDHAQILISAARLAGLPARYVSGYLMMDGQVDQDATHAWAEVYLDGLGWTGFDVSNGVSPDERYVRIAVGRDARDAAPVEGLRMGNSDETLMVSLQVQQ